MVLGIRNFFSYTYRSCRRCDGTLTRVHIGNVHCSSAQAGNTTSTEISAFGGAFVGGTGLGGASLYASSNPRKRADAFGVQAKYISVQSKKTNWLR